jgi:hypothetical protein
MNVDRNDAKEHLVLPGEDVPVGLMLCSQKNDEVVHDAIGGIQASCSRPITSSSSQIPKCCARKSSRPRTFSRHEQGPKERVLSKRREELGQVH